MVDQPIKSLGAHEVSVKLHDEVSATVALNVDPRLTHTARRTARSLGGRAALIWGGGARVPAERI